MVLQKIPKSIVTVGQERTNGLTNNPRNLGIMVALMILGCFIYLTATEYISAKKSKGEILLFRRDKLPDLQPKLDEEANFPDRINTETPSREETVPETPASI